MSLIHILVTVTVFVNIIHADELPYYFMKCRKSDPYLNQCVADSANKALSIFAKGDEVFQIPPLSPLQIPLITLSSRGLNASLFNASVEGISDSKILDAKIDLPGRRFEFLISTPKINIFSSYEIKGRFLLLPIHVNGTANIRFEQLNLKFSFLYNLVNINNLEYIQLTNATLVYAFENISVDLENFSAINNASESKMDDILQRNTLGINGEMGTKIGEAIAESLAKLLNNLFSRVPMNELFNE